MYGPQKGATPEIVARLDYGLKSFGSLLERESKQSLLRRSGIGAAGGTALPLVSIFGVQMQSGLEIVLDTIKFDHLTKGADLIIKVEGKTDNQSPLGKVVSGVGKRAKTQGIPAVVISGALEPGFEALYDQGIVAAFAACNNTLGLEWQMKNAATLLEIQVKNMMGILMSFIVGENFRFVLDSYTMGYFIIKASSKYTYVRKKC